MLPMRIPKRSIFLPAVFLAVLFVGCRPVDYRTDADRVASRIIQGAQLEAMGHTEPFTIERPVDTLRRRLVLVQKLPHSGNAALGADQLETIDHWPEEGYPAADANSSSPIKPWDADKPLAVTLADALRIAARNSRAYQTSKEQVFRAALDLDLEANEFRTLLFADGESVLTWDRSGDDVTRGLSNSLDVSVERKLTTGATIVAGIAVDLVKLLTMDRASSLGLLGDATITIPLLRGAGRHIVTEPLTQAGREVIYALHAFERFRRTLAVRVASEYLGVLRQLDQVQNAADSYRRLIASARRARRLADAGRLPEVQVDQARQDELRARDRWISSEQSYARGLDNLKITLGLPTDAKIELDREELKQLAEGARRAVGGLSDGEPPTTALATVPPADAPVVIEPPSEQGGPLEMPDGEAAKIALEHRLDLRTLLGRVYDAQRDVVIASDALKAGLTLTGTARIGEGRSLSSAGSDDAQLRPAKGVYTAGLLLDLPLERTAERNAYRDSYIRLERAVRAVQELEDQVKFSVRDALRDMLQSRESYRIQVQAVALARRRVDSTDLLLKAGRAEIRDALEAQEALVSAQNALTAALVNYRVAALTLQRDMGVLEVNEKGLWREYEPQSQ